MLYLFGSGSWKDNQKFLKIGFTSDLESRKVQYKIHNPLGEFISVREGDEMLELKMHLRLLNNKADFLDEWFYDEKEVYDVFNSSEEDINKWLWENRGECLLYPSIPSPDSLKGLILKELRELFYNSEEK